MTALEIQYLKFSYSCTFRGIPGRDNDPSDYPQEWTVSIDADSYGLDDEVDEDEVVHVGDAEFRVVPDAGMIDLLDTLDAVDQEMLGVAEMLVHERPDLFFAARMDLGGDLLVLSALSIDPRFRGHRTGHAVLRAILATAARNTTLVVVEAAPLFTDGVLEGSPRHMAAKASLRKYWLEYGFQEAAGDYLAPGCRPRDLRTRRGLRRRQRAAPPARSSCLRVPAGQPGGTAKKSHRSKPLQCR